MTPSAEVAPGLKATATSPKLRPLLAVAATDTVCAGPPGVRSTLTLILPPSRPGVTSASGSCADEGRIASTEAVPPASFCRPAAKSFAAPSSMPSDSQITRSACCLPKASSSRFSRAMRSGSKARGASAAARALTSAAACGSRACGRNSGVVVASVTGAPPAAALSSTSAMTARRASQLLAAAQLSSTTSSTGVCASWPMRPGA